MNILIFSEPSFPRHPGGAGKSTHVLAAELVRRGHRVSILCECHEDTVVEVIDGVTVHRLNTKSVDAAAREERETLTAQHFLHYIEANLQPHLLNLLYDSGGFLSYFFRLARRLVERFGTPYLLHYRYLRAHHRSYEDGGSLRSSLAFAGMERRIWETSQCAPARFANLVVCPSTFQAAFVDAHYRPVSGPARVLPEPVELIVPEPVAARALRARLAPPGARLMYFGGRVDSGLKNADIVARALERVVSKLPTARLVVPVRGQLPQALRRVKKWIIALPWIRDRAELFALLSVMDIGVMPSAYESFGLMCAELLAAGTPVVASPVGGMLDMIENGKNGYLLERRASPERWVEQIAEGCVALLQNPELSTGLRDRAKASVAAYSAQVVGATADEFCRLAAESKRSPVIPQPAFAAADRERYADLLEEFLGPAGLEPAGKALREWPRTVETRCEECTRSSLANEYVDVVRLGRPLRRALATVGGRYPANVASVVDRACPLGLLQRYLPRDPG